MPGKNRVATAVRIAVAHYYRIPLKRVRCHRRLGRRHQVIMQHAARELGVPHLHGVVHEKMTTAHLIRHFMATVRAAEREAVRLS